MDDGRGQTPMIARGAFLNRVRSLYNIDRAQLPWMTDSQWMGFRTDPARFVIRCSDNVADRILEIVEKRQATTIPPTDRTASEEDEPAITITMAGRLALDRVAPSDLAAQTET